MKLLLIAILLFSVGCKTAFDKAEHFMTANEARELSMKNDSNIREKSLEVLLTKLIPKAAADGDTAIWIPGYADLNLTSHEAVTLRKFGYTVEMCKDVDFIAYVRWN